jgi:hypothetical protein
MGRDVRGASCPWGELSMGRVVLGASCPSGKLSMGQNACGASCRGVSFRRASFNGASGPGTVVAHWEQWWLIGSSGGSLGVVVAPWEQ